MKKLSTLILILTLTSTVKAQPDAYGAFMIYWTSSIGSYAIQDHFFENKEFRVSGSLDGSNLFVENKVDYVLRTGIKIDKLEPFIAFEHFNYNKYHSLALGLKYHVRNKRFDVVPGIHSARIWNRNPTKLQIAQNIGFSIEIKYLIWERLSIFVQSQIDTRPELADPAFKVFNVGCVGSNYGGISVNF